MARPKRRSHPLPVDSPPPSSSTQSNPILLDFTSLVDRCLFLSSTLHPTSRSQGSASVLAPHRQNLYQCPFFLIILLFMVLPRLSSHCTGTMTFGEQNSLPQSFRLLDQALASGINFFDSAEMLAPYSSYLSSELHFGWHMLLRWIMGGPVFELHLRFTGTQFLSGQRLRAEARRFSAAGSKPGISLATASSWPQRSFL